MDRELFEDYLEKVEHERQEKREEKRRREQKQVNYNSNARLKFSTNVLRVYPFSALFERWENG